MRKRPRKPAQSAKTGKGRRLVLLGFIGIAIIAVIGAWARWQAGRSSAEAKYVPRPQGQITFNKDIAPIVFQHCTGCHRPGQSAPFSLLGYQDVKKRAVNIADVTARRFMPPWLPEHGYGVFAGDG